MYLHDAAAHEGLAQDAVDAQVWHLAWTLLHDHEPAEVVRLLDAMRRAETGAEHRAALSRVSEALGRWR